MPLDRASPDVTPAFLRNLPPSALRFILLLALVVPAPAANADPRPSMGGGTTLEAALSLYRAKRYPEARAAFEAIAAAEPENAAACYYLGRTLQRRGDSRALADAVPWLEKAVTLDPHNAEYLADYGGASMQLGDRAGSFSAATRGRDAMEKSLAINPANLDAREGLFQFYARAPWPLGSKAKAAAQLEEIRKLDPIRATALAVLAKANARDYAAAFQLCEEILAANPDDYTALYQYGRTADLSGQNLERGLACLLRCVQLKPPGPASPTQSEAWFRVGTIRERLQQPDEARTAYATALKLDAGNRQARDALAKLK
jgi:tetratricopeptide (TPR) repeat protein